MIRAINLLEVDKFAALGRWFHESVLCEGPFNTSSFCTHWRAMISSGVAFILGRFDEVDESPREAIGTVLYPDVASGEMTAATAFWFYVEEPKGLEAGLLYEAWEKECRARNAKVAFTVALCNERLHRVGSFLMKSGYSLFAMQYRKEL